METCERLADIEAIKQLKARYFRFVDLKMWAELKEQVFAPDIQISFPETREEPYGREDAMTWIVYALKDCVSIHHGHMPEIEITSPTTARAIWPMEDILEFNEAGIAALGVARLHGWGHYHETYEKLDGAWRIKTTRLTRLRVVTENAPRVVT